LRGGRFKALLKIIRRAAERSLNNGIFHLNLRRLPRIALKKYSPQRFEARKPLVA
jgi:hypothetical protein